MNKSELIDATAAGLELTKVDAARVVDFFFDAETGIISRSLVNGEEVKLQGFGIFGVSERKARNGINPKTGEKLKIPASKSPRFRAGSVLKKTVR